MPLSYQVTVIQVTVIQMIVTQMTCIMKFLSTLL